MTNLALSNIKIKHPWLLFLGIAIGPVMNGISLLAIAIAIQPMAKSLAIDIATLQWFLTAFAIGIACFLVTSGRLADVFGHKIVILCGFVLFIVSSLIIAISFSPAIIIVARFLQGASGGIMATTGIAILTSFYQGDERSNWVSKLVGMGGVGMAIGPVIGGVLIDHFGWRSIFLINLPIGLLGILLIAIYVPKPQLLCKKDLDIFGMLLLSVALVFLTIGLTQGHYWGWSDIKTLLCFSARFFGLFCYFM